jgi:hypothetical protein
LYLQYDWTLFKNNYRNLRSSILTKRNAVKFDQEAFEKEQAAFPRNQLTKRGNPFWDTSDAKRILLVELKDDNIGPIISNMKPKEVHERHPEYKLFDLDVFRNHLYHEKSNLKQNVFWQVKRNRKARSRHERDAAQETSLAEE